MGEKRTGHWGRDEGTEEAIGTGLVDSQGEESSILGWLALLWLQCWVEMSSCLG